MNTFTLYIEILSLLNLLQIIPIGYSTVIQKSQNKNSNKRPFASRSSASECTLLPNQKYLSVLPGSGWDNLVNCERGPIIDVESYSLCRRSVDGKFLLPDDITIQPLKNSEIKLSSEVYESISECRSLVAYSINSALGGEYSFFRINGDFSSDKETLREKLSQKLGLIVQSEIRHNRYFIQLIPDPKLHSRFKNRLLDIAAFLERGNVTMETIELFNNGLIGHTLGDSLTNENFKSLKEGMNAFYLADLVIRDFGTHCVNSIHAGGVLAKIDTLDTSTLNIKKEDRWHLGASASTSFANLFKVKLAGSVKNNDTLVESYESKVTYSQILTYGGPIIYMSNVNLSLWESSLDNQLVAIDRSGQPIYELITDRSLPELPGHMIVRLTATLKSAVERYYKANTVVGCMNPLSMFYDNEANVASTECDLHGRQITNSTLYLGGVYQKCTGPEDLCLSETIANPLTGDLTCSQGFTPVQLLPQQIRRCYSVCNEKSWFKSRDCTTNCAITESYWCSRDPSLSSSPKVLDIDENGYLFGGLYTDKEVNSLTKQYNCPQYYWPIALGRRMRICLSSDRELGGKYSLPFGGFYSCFSGNPLTGLINGNVTNKMDAEGKHAGMPEWFKQQQGRKVFSQNFQQQPQKYAAGRSMLHNDNLLPISELSRQNDYSQLFSALWPKKCPPGYTAHLAAMEDICQVNYCVEANLLKEQTRRQLKRPPFVMPIYAKEEKLPPFQNYLEGRSGLNEFSFDSHLFKLGGSNNFIGSSSDVIHDTNGNMIRKINGRWEEPDQLKTDNNLYAKSQNIHYAFIATLCTLLPVIIILILVISILAFYYIRQQNRFISRRN
ncbi:Macrophage-expressed 1 protein isoform 1 [Schistosoma japonicum]|uniref:Macrophage-expressed 1 protein isoform 1 n=1 Tax=Schistosoma japonicum TaxID=6182 RepID=A0A4Z2DUX9_SCHJA|nr:Macrophage-expressed 1 protein isoform 1 [Schistosoma japonicum]